jgi:hypothetical protein
MRLKLLACLIVSLSVAGVLDATEIRVVRFIVLPNSNPPPCVSVAAWSSETFFHNSTDAVQTVQFLGVSNGSARPNATPLSVPPHQTVKIIGYDPFLNWDPMPGTILFVTRLDVPTGVIVANRVASTVYDVGPDPTHIPCIGRPTNYAGLPLPVVGTLVPAGTAQYFLGTDVGSDPAAAQLDARLNVGVYNGGTASATATVRVYCGDSGSAAGFPNSLVLSNQIQIPGNAVIQKTVVASTLLSGCPIGGNESFWYATVTVDQPSFAYAIGLANGALPTFPGTVALTYTGN